MKASGKTATNTDMESHTTKTIKTGSSTKAGGNTVKITDKESCTI
jgi:hypothetical protein